MRGSEIVGFGQGLCKQLQMLNRTVRINDNEDCVELEADDKHVKLMI